MEVINSVWRWLLLLPVIPRYYSVLKAIHNTPICIGIVPGLVKLVRFKQKLPSSETVCISGVESTRYVGPLSLTPDNNKGHICESVSAVL